MRHQVDEEHQGRRGVDGVGGDGVCQPVEDGRQTQPETAEYQDTLEALNKSVRTRNVEYTGLFFKGLLSNFKQ